MSAAPPTDGRQRLLFGVVAAAAALVAGTFWVLLSSSAPADARGDYSGLGLLVSGGIAAVSLVLRVRWSDGRPRRAWALLAAAAVVALVGNVASGLTAGPDPYAPPPPVSDVSVALALSLSIAGLAYLAHIARRGVDLLVMGLDGVILGAAVLLIASRLVYPQLLAEQARDVSLLAGLVIPLLDVVLATMALILLRRTRGTDRLTIALLASGFIVYTMTDLSFADRLSEGVFRFGSAVDVGWMVGYLLLGLAAWWPARLDEDRAEPVTVSGAEGWDTAVVFGVLVVVVMVEAVVGNGSALVGAQVVMWFVLVAATGLRQSLIARENSQLRRGLEHQVRERTAQLRQMGRQTEVMLTSVAEGIYGVDVDGRVTFVNPSGARMLGYTVAELAGRDAHELFHAPAEDGTPYPAARCYIAEAVGSRMVSHAEEDFYLRADGETFPVEITASPLIDSETDEVRGGVVVFRDVTQRREVERMKNEFLSVVSHELRTPLTSIRGSLGLLDGGVLGELPAPAAAMVARAVQSSERLTRMINDILDLERIESGNLALDLGEHDVDDLLAVAVREMAGLAATREVELVRGEPCGARVTLDRDRVVQALTNLIGNAVKFSPAGAEVTVSATSGPEQVLLQVRDHGRGIPADRLDTIFERFEQVDSSDRRQQGGSGLGLAICRGIVEGHGGRVWLDSEYGAGTTASVLLPVAVRVPGTGSHAGGGNDADPVTAG